MNKSLVFKNKFYLFISYIFAFFLFMYLVHFLINGQRGVVEYFKLKNLNFKYSLNLNSLNNDNNILIDKIQRLQPNTIDLDYLDEKVRENLGFVDKNEIIVIFD